MRARGWKPRVGAAGTERHGMGGRKEPARPGEGQTDVQADGRGRVGIRRQPRASAFVTGFAEPCEKRSDRNIKAFHWRLRRRCQARAPPSHTRHPPAAHPPAFLVCFFWGGGNGRFRLPEMLCRSLPTASPAGEGTSAFGAGDGAGGLAGLGVPHAKPRRCTGIPCKPPHGGVSVPVGLVRKTPRRRAGAVRQLQHPVIKTYRLVKDNFYGNLAGGDRPLRRHVPAGTGGSAGTPRAGWGTPRRIPGTAAAGGSLPAPRSPRPGGMLRRCGGTMPPSRGLFLHRLHTAAAGFGKSSSVISRRAREKANIY